MSNISAPSTIVKPTRSTAQKQGVLKQNDLELAAERLALIQGHISHMPVMCISGVTIMDGFLLVAFKIPDHVITILDDGEWQIDGKNIIDMTKEAGHA